MGGFGNEHAGELSQLSMSCRKHSVVVWRNHQWCFKSVMYHSKIIRDRCLMIPEVCWVFYGDLRLAMAIAPQWASATCYIVIYKMISTSNCSREGDYFIDMLEELIKRLLCASLHPRFVLAAGWAYQAGPIRPIWAYQAYQGLSDPYLEKRGALIHQIQRLSS
jgi:hypothetical protein